MTKNKGRFRPFTFRLSSADWSGIFGQCAIGLRSQPRSSTSRRLKRYFAAYWALSFTCFRNCLVPRPTLRSKFKPSSKSRKDPEGSSTCVKIVHHVSPDRS